MIIVLSPAKSLDFSPAASGLPMTSPELKDQIAELSKVTKKLSRAELRRLMGISEKLAELNHQRFQTFDPSCEEGLQAAIAFDGDVYEGLDARSLDRKGLSFAQEHVRILSGLYGVLRPLDALQPYRLEMGVRLKTRRGARLYDFWGPRIAQALNRAADEQADPTLVNCASQEYFGSVDRKALNLPVVTCHFKEESGNRQRVIGFYAKKARGLIARYAIDRRIDRAAGLKAFDSAGYTFRPDQSTATDWIFARPQPPAQIMTPFVDLTGQVAVITGSTSGIGLAMAEALAGQGCNIVLNGLGEMTAIEAVRGEIESEYGVQALYHGADMTRPGEIGELINVAHGEFGRVDILLNNAGIQHVAPVEDFPSDMWEKIIAINLSSAFYATKAVTPLMKHQGSGRIVNLASVHGLVASPFKAAYVAAKHGVLGLTKTVALELAEHGVTCNAICPGYVHTPLVDMQITDQAKARGITPEAVVRDVILAAQPTRQFVTYEQIAGALLYLVSPAGASANGMTMVIDGGWTAA